VLTDGTDQALAFVEETRHILRAAEDRGLVLRAVGSVGVRMSADLDDLLAGLGRVPPNDIDLIGASAQRSGYRELFDELGY